MLRPSSVFTTNGFRSVRSAAHWVLSEDANQSIFLEQVSLSSFVLQVPQTMLFSDVTLFCACFQNRQLGTVRLYSLDRSSRV